MRRFVLRFLLGSMAMLVAYEAVQSMVYREEETSAEDWQVAGFTHALLTEALKSEPPPRTPAELAAHLGVPVTPLAEADWLDARDRALFSASQHGIELVVLPMDEDAWRIVALVPSGPVAIDAWDVFEEQDESVDLAHLLSLMVLALGMAALGVALVASPARQLQRLAHTARALQGGDLTARTEVPTGGLVAPVTRALNAMAEELQRVMGWQELMLQTVAHELRTPLARVRFVAQRVADATSDGERTDALAALDVDLTELEELVSSVLSLVRADHGETLARVSVDVDALVRGALDRFKRVQLRPSIQLEYVGPEAPSLWADLDSAAARRVFDNLLRNAVAHARGRVRITVAPEDSAILVAVEDDGDGLPAKTRHRVFEPFVRVDDDRAGTGTGLGLAIVKGLAEAHGRPVVLCRSALGGLRVETRWPRSVATGQAGAS